MDQQMNGETFDVIKHGSVIKELNSPQNSQDNLLSPSKALDQALVPGENANLTIA